MLGSRVQLPQPALTVTLNRPQAYIFMYYDIIPHFTEVEINVLVHWGPMKGCCSSCMQLNWQMSEKKRVRSTVVCVVQPLRASSSQLAQLSSAQCTSPHSSARLNELPGPACAGSALAGSGS